MASELDGSEFRAKAELVTGMSWDEILWWGSRLEFEEQQHAKDLGHCCLAGLIASPGPCPWHIERRDGETA